jgi:hypothetical protein
VPAFKRAAGELLLECNVNILSYAAAFGVAMTSESLLDALIPETKSGGTAVCGDLVDACGDGNLAGRAPLEKGDGAGNVLYFSTTFRINGVDAGRAGEAGRQILKIDGTGGSRWPLLVPAQGAILRPTRIQANGVRTLPSCTRRH